MIVGLDRRQIEVDWIGLAWTGFLEDGGIELILGAPLNQNWGGGCYVNGRGEWQWMDVPHAAKVVLPSEMDELHPCTFCYYWSSWSSSSFSFFFSIAWVFLVKEKERKKKKKKKKPHN